jgi:hypothetical protein
MLTMQSGQGGSESLCFHRKRRKVVLLLRNLISIQSYSSSCFRYLSNLGECWFREPYVSFAARLPNSSVETEHAVMRKTRWMDLPSVLYIQTTQQYRAIVIRATGGIKYTNTIHALKQPQYTPDVGACGGWGTALQTGRLRVRFPMVSLDIFHWH